MFSGGLRKADDDGTDDMYNFNFTAEARSAVPGVEVPPLTEKCANKCSGTLNKHIAHCICIFLCGVTQQSMPRLLICS